MNDDTKRTAVCRKGAGAAPVLLVAFVGALAAGCETRVVRSEGIGATQSHPETEESVMDDPLNALIFNDNDTRRTRY